MSRLLFAAARKARIETGTDEDWITSHSTRIEHANKYPGFYRIHPDDEHLQYGPISTALRGAAAKDFCVYEEHRKVYTYAAFEMADTYETSWQNRYENENQRVLFMLILAEALADEGL